MLDLQEVLNTTALPDIELESVDWITKNVDPNLENITTLIKTYPHISGLAGLSAKLMGMDILPLMVYTFTLLAALTKEAQDRQAAKLLATAEKIDDSTTETP